MKIKTKKVITEKEYLHYVIDKTDCLSISHDFTHIDHDIVHSDIVLELHDHNNVTYGKTWVDSEGETVFEVDIEEEITENTKFCELVVKDIDGMYSDYSDISISDFFLSRIRTIYMLNKDDTLTLIWKDGKLI